MTRVESENTREASLSCSATSQNFVLLQISRYAEVLDSLVTSLSQISHYTYVELIPPYLQQRLQDTSLQQVENVVETMATNADALTDELLQQSAEAKALTDAQKYMVYYAKATAEGQQVQEFWARLREHAQSRLTGKSPARLIRAEPQATFILESSPNSSDSSPTLNNGTTSE